VRSLHGPRLTSRPLNLFIVSACAAGALAACGSSTTHASTSGEPRLVGPIEVVTTPQQIARPLDTYLPSAQELVQLQEIQVVVTNRCLAAAGDEPMQVSGDIPTLVGDAVAARTQDSSLWGFFDPDAAATQGYALPAGHGAGLTLAFPNDAAGAACQAKGEAAVGGPEGVALTDESSLPAGGPPTPVQDSRVVAAYQSWSKCMRQSGFNYPDPVTVEQQWPRSAGQTASPDEIATAVADNRCKISTNLVGVTLAVQLAYDQRYLDKNQQSLVAFKDKWESYLRAGTTK
jgi:hypothetical protein